MGWFAASNRLSMTAVKALEEMADAGEGEASAVAAALNDFAEDVDEGEPDASDETMVSVAHNMIGWLERFIEEVGDDDPVDDDDRSYGPRR